MKKRMLRNLEVSEIGMGCMGFSHGYGQVPDEAYAIRAIEKAHDFGCILFDTAETYGREMFYPGHNEELVGKALSPYRKETVLATKFHIHLEELEGGVPLCDVICRHLEASMKRLRTDYIDLYYLHRVNEQIPVEDVARAMGKLIEKGLIRGWGLSQVDVDIIDRAQNVTPISALQNIYSMVERDMEKAVIPYCMEHGIGVVPFSPIASGLLSGKITTETKFERNDDVRNWVPQLSKANIAGNQPIIDLLRRYGDMKQATPAQISLAWMLHKYPNVVPIPGSKNKERIVENLDASLVELTDEEFRSLEEALNQCRVYGHRGFAR